MPIPRTVDCHVHVFCPDQPLSPKRVWDPLPMQMGTVDNLVAVHDSHGVTHALLVGAGPHGPDNSCMLQAMRRFPDRFKAIALVDNDITADQLSELATSGCVGVRINLFTQGSHQLTGSGARNLLNGVREAGLLIQIQADAQQIHASIDDLRAVEVPLVIDHLGRPDVTGGVEQPGFQDLLALGREGRAILKLSGPFRAAGSHGYPYLDIDPFVHAALDAFGLDNCVWGSDWPFVRMDERVDFGPVADCIERWLPDEADRNKVLWDTPARVFGFA